jgi:hypothetical protein
MVRGIVSGVVRVWLLALITSLLMAIVMVLVQWVRRKELLAIPLPVLAMLYFLFFAWISTGFVGAVVAFILPPLRHCVD